uniref:Ig-like domain-containing protein n=1 Tax=Electrophorus electricus TaxID=8005 RepID=A0AAY5EIJ6_ELEEL
HLTTALWQEVTSSAQLTVTPSEEPLFTRKLEALEVMEGRSAHFDCKVSGTPPPEKIDSTYDRKMTHTLLISSVQPADSGVYTCIARNLAGEVSCKAELTVHTGKHQHAVYSGKRRPHCPHH